MASSFFPIIASTFIYKIYIKVYMLNEQFKEIVYKKSTYIIIL
jgi:hypothetical protein